MFEGGDAPYSSQRDGGGTPPPHHARRYDNIARATDEGFEQSSPETSPTNAAAASAAAAAAQPPLSSGQQRAASSANVGRSSSGTTATAAPTAEAIARQVRQILDQGVWREAKQPGTNRSYYYHTITQKTTWDLVKELGLDAPVAPRAATPHDDGDFDASSEDEAEEESRKRLAAWQQRTGGGLGASMRGADRTTATAEIAAAAAQAASASQPQVTAAPSVTSGAFESGFVAFASPSTTPVAGAIAGPFGSISDSTGGGGGAAGVGQAMTTSIGTGSANAPPITMGSGIVEGFRTAFVAFGDRSTETPVASTAVLADFAASMQGAGPPAAAGGRSFSSDGALGNGVIVAVKSEQDASMLQQNLHGTNTTLAAGEMSAISQGSPAAMMGDVSAAFLLNATQPSAQRRGAVAALPGSLSAPVGASADDASPDSMGPAVVIGAREGAHAARGGQEAAEGAASLGRQFPNMFTSSASASEAGLGATVEGGGGFAAAGRGGEHRAATGAGGDDETASASTAFSALPPTASATDAGRRATGTSFDLPPLAATSVPSAADAAVPGPTRGEPPIGAAAGSIKPASVAQLGVSALSLRASREQLPPGAFSSMVDATPDTARRSEAAMSDSTAFSTASQVISRLQQTQQARQLAAPVVASAAATAAPPVGGLTVGAANGEGAATGAFAVSSTSNVQHYHGGAPRIVPVDVATPPPTAPPGRPAVANGMGPTQTGAIGTGVGGMPDLGAALLMAALNPSGQPQGPQQQQQQFPVGWTATGTGPVLSSGNGGGATVGSFGPAGVSAAGAPPATVLVAPPTAAPDPAATLRAQSEALESLVRTYALLTASAPGGAAADAAAARGAFGPAVRARVSGAAAAVEPPATDFEVARQSQMQQRALLHALRIASAGRQAGAEGSADLGAFFPPAGTLWVPTPGSGVAGRDHQGHGARVHFADDLEQLAWVGGGPDAAAGGGKAAAAGTRAARQQQLDREETRLDRDILDLVMGLVLQDASAAAAAGFPSAASAATTSSRRAGATSMLVPLSDANPSDADRVRPKPLSAAGQERLMQEAAAHVQGADKGAHRRHTDPNVRTSTLPPTVPLMMDTGLASGGTGAQLIDLYSANLTKFVLQDVRRRLRRAGEVDGEAGRQAARDEMALIRVVLLDCAVALQRIARRLWQDEAGEELLRRTTAAAVLGGAATAAATLSAPATMCLVRYAGPPQDATLRATASKILHCLPFEVVESPQQPDPSSTGTWPAAPPAVKSGMTSSARYAFAPAAAPPPTLSFRLESWAGAAHVDGAVEAVQRCLREVELACADAYGAFYNRTPTARIPSAATVGLGAAGPKGREDGGDGGIYILPEAPVFDVLFLDTKRALAPVSSSLPPTFAAVSLVRPSASDRVRPSDAPGPEAPTTLYVQDASNVEQLLFATHRLIEEVAAHAADDSRKRSVPSETSTAKAQAEARRTAAQWKPAAVRAAAEAAAVQTVGRLLDDREIRAAVVREAAAEVRRRVEALDPAAELVRRTQEKVDAMVQRLQVELDAHFGTAENDDGAEMAIGG